MSKRKKNTASGLGKAFVAIVGLIAVSTAAYYRWAAGLENRKASVAAMSVPPVLLLALMIGGGADSSSTPEQIVATESEQTEVLSTSSLEKVIPAPEATYPVTVTRSGADFQNTFDGTMEVYPDKTVVTATWSPECGEGAPVAQQTQKFTHTMPAGSFEMETTREFSDCMNNEGTLSETDTYRIDSDGTIRVDLIDDDSSLIREDFVVIEGGPAPEVIVETPPEPEPVEEEYYEPEPVYAPPSRPTYSTCAEYNSAGRGNFTPSDPEYSNRRERDNDGIACEF